MTQVNKDWQRTLDPFKPLSRKIAQEISEEEPEDEATEQLFTSTPNPESPAGRRRLCNYK